MLPPLEELLAECERLHGHMCPGQVLGARMALLGCAIIGITDPRQRERKDLIVWVEIDRCMTDAISAVTGVRLGKRSLKYIDYGKVAATFLNLPSGCAARVVALESSRELADTLFPSLENKRDRQMRTYLSASDNDLFSFEQVKVKFSDFDLPGRPRSRVFCSRCGEGVNDGREVLVEGALFCKACALGSYYSYCGATRCNAAERESIVE
jgi:formylmethanofuran dehydrogenase subunit E